MNRRSHMAVHWFALTCDVTCSLSRHVLTIKTNCYVSLWDRKCRQQVTWKYLHVSIRLQHHSPEYVAAGLSKMFVAMYQIIRDIHKNTGSRLLWYEYVATYVTDYIVPCPRSCKQLVRPKCWHLSVRLYSFSSWKTFRFILTFAKISNPVQITCMLGIVANNIY
jgi:hypothetical protein